MRKIEIGDASLLSVVHARRAVRKLQQEAEQSRHHIEDRRYDLGDVFEAFMAEPKAKRCSVSYEQQNLTAWRNIPAALRRREQEGW
ncbi:MAG: hypothetical protein HRU33_15935 [Rhodobacteraceae bacterium]|nr:hypothetical protein [Paracoccaceae bacterium]